MQFKSALCAMLAALPLFATAADAPKDAKLAAVIASSDRSATNKARDAYRHPYETLTFFGIKPNMTVVELWPFGGWYTEILAPYLKGSGTLYAAAMDPASTAKSDIGYNSALKAMFDAKPALFAEVKQTVLTKGKYEIAPDGSADMVLTFRNIHNWAGQGIAKDVFAAAFRALKPGGVLGVEEHRNRDPGIDGTKRDLSRGYMGEDYSIALIESVGFKLAGKSDINNNPRDTKDYPKGVWTLPPNYAEGDTERAKYTAIGESDRFTLKFVKPKS